MERRYGFYVNLILGLWLLVSPWILGIANMINALWSHIILGAIVTLSALWRALEPEDEGRVWASWVTAVAGVLALVLPWAFGYSSTLNQMLNDVIAGLVIAALAIWTATGWQLAEQV